MDPPFDPLLDESESSGDGDLFLPVEHPNDTDDESNGGVSGTRENAGAFKKSLNGSFSSGHSKSSSPELINGDLMYPKFEYERKFGKKNNRECMAVLNEIREKNLPFPLFRYFCKPDIVQTAFDNLKNYKPDWIVRSHHELKGHPGTWWLPSLFRGAGMQMITRKNDWWQIDVAIDYFTEYERVKAKKEYANSMEQDWYTDSELIKAIKHCETKGIVNCENLRNGMFYVGRELALFRVTKTKGFLQAILFNDKEGKTSSKEFTGKRWLDMSAGWGDRVFTACALNMDYLGFDPNAYLEIGHSEIIKMVGNKDKQRIIYKPFETEETAAIIAADVATNGLFDICMTSPPFYIIERYNGENQSTDSYPEFAQWMVKFLFKSLQTAWTNLKDGGYLAINIANIRNCDMVGPMQLFIEDFLPRSSWEGIITFSGRGTQDAPGAVYVWKKALASEKITRWNQRIARSLKQQFPALYWLHTNSSTPC